MNPEDTKNKYFNLDLVKADAPNKNNNVLTKESLEQFVEQLKNTPPQPVAEKFFVHPKTLQKVKAEAEKKSPIFEMGDLNIQSNPFVPEGNIYATKGQDVFSQITAQAGKTMAKNIEEKLFSSIGVSASAVDNRKFTIDDLEHMINSTGNGHLIRLLAKKLGRAVIGNDVKRILDYLYRHSTSIMAEKAAPIFDEHLNPDNFMEQMKVALEELPGVKATIIDNNYPESASIIVKVDTKAMDETEADFIATGIYSTIQKYKLEGLDELEVIYHNKEVY